MITLKGFNLMVDIDMTIRDDDRYTLHTCLFHAACVIMVQLKTRVPYRLAMRGREIVQLENCPIPVPTPGDGGSWIVYAAGQRM
jgi:hypothetical protein